VRFAVPALALLVAAATLPLLPAAVPQVFCREAVPAKEMVATFDGGGVTAEEFLTEYRRAAQKYAGYDITKYKEEILANIATSKILAMEARERGFVDEEGEADPRVIKTKERAMINQLRRDVILKGITAPEEDVKRLYEMSKFRRLTRAIAVGNKADAEMIMEELSKGADFVALAKEWSLDVPSAKWNAILAWVKAGDAPENAERLIASLQPGEIGGPVETLEGYYIFRVDSLYRKEDLPSFEEMQPLLHTKVLQRRRTPVREAYMDSVIEAKGVRADEETMRIVIDRFEREGWVEDDEPGRQGRIPDFTPEELARPVLTYDGGSYNLDEYLQYIRDKKSNPGYWLSGEEEMQRGLRRFARDRLELAVAYELGMDKVKSVRGQVRKKATDVGIVDMLVEAAGGEESVRTTEEDLRAFYEQNKWKYTEPGAIVISVITVKSGEVIDDLYADMKSGIPFSKLAEDYKWVSNEDLTAERMRLTQDSKSRYPKIFDTARRMKVGDVCEPIPLGKHLGFAVIKLIDREPGRVLPFEQVEEEVRVDLNLQILNEAAERLVEFKESMREKYHYRVNEELFQKLEL